MTNKALAEKLGIALGLALLTVFSLSVFVVAVVLLAKFVLWVL